MLRDALRGEMGLEHRGKQTGHRQMQAKEKTKSKSSCALVSHAGNQGN